MCKSDDTISRKAAIDALANELYHNEEDYRTAVKAIGGLSSAEPKKGRWIRNDNGTYSCSVCQSWIPEEQHYYARYCIYCGTKMEVDE